MSKKEKSVYKSYLVMYFVVSAAIAVLATLIKNPVLFKEGPAFLKGVEVVGIGLIGLVFVFMWLYWRKGGKHQAIIGTHARIIKKTRHFILAWIGAGLAIYSIALFASATHPVNIVAAMFVGPFAGFFCRSKVIVILIFVVYSTAVALGLHEADVGKGDKPLPSIRKMADKFHELKGDDHAPREKPEDGHFVETKKAISRYVIKEDELDLRVSTGVVMLAENWGRIKAPTWIGLPKEGSGLLVGAPGSGKGNIYRNILLNVRKPVGDELPTKVVVLSVKPRDLAAETVRWLRSQCETVGMWDLSGSTAGTDRYGDEKHWSPTLSCKSFDAAKRTAKRLAEAGRDPNTRESDQFWTQSIIAIFSPALYAAYLAGQSYETALLWAESWTNPEFNEVDRILFGHGETDALRVWQDMRTNMLKRDGELSWKPATGPPPSGATGPNIATSFSNLLLNIKTESAFRASANANFSPREWLRAEGNAAMFFVGDTQEKGTTRSLLATCLHELLTEANAFAREHDDEKLPYRLIVLADELANLAPIPDLQEFYSTARSTRIQILSGFQSFGQIEGVYGKDVAAVLFDASVLIVILSGISDANLINDLGTIGGSKRVEMGDDDKPVARPLIEGQVTGALKPPDPETGEPGDAIAIMSGGIAMMTIPFWFMEKRYDNRGEVLPHFAENTQRLRDDADPWGIRREKAKARFADQKDRTTTWWKNRHAEPERLLLTVGSYVAAPPDALGAATNPNVEPPACANLYLDKLNGEIVTCGENGDLCPVCELSPARPPSYTAVDVIPVRAGSPSGTFPVRAGARGSQPDEK